MLTSNPKTGDQAVKRSIALYEAVLARGETQALSVIAREFSLSTSTAYRLLTPYIQAGWLRRIKRGQLAAGPRLLSAALSLDVHKVLARTARPFLAALAAQLGQTVHLGVLENAMVTYLVKETPNGIKEGWTRESMQLEAYCSGIGKVLLAHLPGQEQALYLSDGHFIALTQHTQIDPAKMRLEWETVRRRGYALDVEEIAMGLTCIAVPVRTPQGHVCAAISTSRYGPEGEAHAETALQALPALQACAAQVLQAPPS
ncbi:MAG: IclR family transcriptional regulator [Pseudomonadota bacterium]